MLISSYSYIDDYRSAPRDNLLSIICYYLLKGQKEWASLEKILKKAHDLVLGNCAYKKSNFVHFLTKHLYQWKF